MTPSKQSLILLIIYIWVSVLSVLFGFINIEYWEIIAYALLFLGMTIYYPSYNKNYTAGIFWGSAIFLTGVISFISSYFELVNISGMIISALLFILSFSILLIFLADTDNKKFLYISILIGAFGVFTLIDSGNPALSSFLNAIESLLGKFWIILLLTIVTIIILNIEKKKDQLF